MNLRNTMPYYLLIAVVILLCGKQTIIAQQKPGAVSAEVELWLKADGYTFFPGNGDDVDEWEDFSGKGRDYVRYSTNAVPKFIISDHAMNYQPSMYFGTSATKLVSREQHFVQANRSYHVFYVSETNRTATDQVVYSFNAERHNYVGWYNNQPLMYTGGATLSYRSLHQEDKKLYGINLAMRPNDTATPLKSYLNGVPNNPNLIGFEPRPMLMGTGVGVVGVRNTTTTFPFQGYIQEIIVLSLPQGEYLSDADIAKTNSYLALKYGITLKNCDYVDSDNEVIWNNTTAGAYTKNIFGIGYDIASGLNQKQSTSYDNRVMAVYLAGSDLAELNALNNGSFQNDKEFAIFGSNGESDKISYTHTVEEEFQEGTYLHCSTTERDKEVFLARVTTSTGKIKVNIRSYNYASAVLISKTANDFDVSDTRVFPLVDNDALNIEIEDGEYISFAYSSDHDITPGGISTPDINLELWLKADGVLDYHTDSIPVTHWKDFSIKNRDHFKYSTSEVPIMRKEGMNYQPTLDFSVATNAKLAATNYIEDNKAYHIIYVSEKTGGNTNQTVYALNQGRDNIAGWYYDQPYFTMAGVALAN